jgi:acyl-CoA-dependent ceramide synthase
MTDDQLAKMFRYLSLTTLCDATFVVFLVSWLITRQFGLVFIIQVIHRNHHVITAGWNPDAGSYYSPRTINIFLVALSLLLCLTTVWFYMACMVAVRVLRGLGAEDSRSDEEDEGSPLEDVPEIHTSQMGESDGKGVVGDGGLKKRR